jgi:hypothetical protein
MAMKFDNKEDNDRKFHIISNSQALNSTGGEIVCSCYSREEQAQGSTSRVRSQYSSVVAERKFKS